MFYNGGDPFEAAPVILKLKKGASQHGFSNPAEAAAAGLSFAVLDGDGRPDRVGLPFRLEGANGYGVSFLSVADLWGMKDVEVDVLFVDALAGQRTSDQRSSLEADRLVGRLRDVRDDVIAIRRSVSLAGPADHAALMFISAIDGLSAFLGALQAPARCAAENSSGI